VGRPKLNDSGERGLEKAEPEGKAPALSAEVNFPNDLAAAMHVENKDPDKNYRYVRKPKKDKDIELRKFQGYTVVPKSEGGKEVGDMVLMSCPKGAFEARRERIAKKNRDRQKTDGKDFHQLGNKLGVQTFEEHKVR